LISIGLWALTVLALGSLFVRGTTQTASDRRTAVVLKPAEKDLVLAEMRVLLSAVQGTVAGLRTGERANTARIVRAAGMAQAADVNPALMAKLPLAFKQNGMSVHEDFDGLAAAIERGTTEEETLARLDSILQRCVGCHAGYRLQAAE